MQLKKVHKPPGFKQKYSATDIALLAEMDERYDTPSGAVIKKLCERAYCIFNEDDYKNMANISVSHLYNLPHSTSYKKQRRTIDKTKSRQIVIGERHKPNAIKPKRYRGLSFSGGCCNIFCLKAFVVRAIMVFYIRIARVLLS